VLHCGHVVHVSSQILNNILDVGYVMNVRRSAFYQWLMKLTLATVTLAKALAINIHDTRTGYASYYTAHMVSMCSNK